MTLSPFPGYGWESLAGKAEKQILKVAVKENFAITQNK